MPIIETPPENPLVLILSCRLSPPERVMSALAQTARLFPGAQVEIIDGLTAHDPRAVALLDGARSKRKTKRPPTPSEVATYGTHRLAWQRLLDTNRSHAIIFEDDFQIIDHPAFLALMVALPQILAMPMHMLKLFDYPRSNNGGLALCRIVEGLTLCQWARPRAGLVGYILTAEGARRFLSRDKIFRVVDEDTKYFWELGLDIWSLHPSPVADGSAAMGGSMLDHDRNISRSNRSLRRSLWGNALTIHRRAFGSVAFAWACILSRKTRLVNVR